MRYGIFKCANCGNEYEKISSRHKTCCQKCSTALWYKEHKKEPPGERIGICLNCGETFERKRNGMGQKYCTNRCRLEYIKVKNISEARTCEECGSTFELRKSGAEKKYCSIECRIKHNRKKYADLQPYKSAKEKIYAKCPGCQKTYQTFINYIGTGTPRFFCPDCKKRNSYIVSYIPNGRDAETMATL